MLRTHCIMSAYDCVYKYSVLYLVFSFSIQCGYIWGFLVVKNLPANAGDVRDLGLIPGSGRSPGETHGNPFQDSCLKNPMDRRAWWTTVHGVAKSVM